MPYQEHHKATLRPLIKIFDIIKHFSQETNLNTTSDSLISNLGIDNSFPVFGSLDFQQFKEVFAFPFKLMPG